MIVHGHALAHEALGAGQAHAALVGEEFADGTDAAATEVIDIVDHAFAALEADEVLGGEDDVVALEDALLKVGLENELLVDLVAADAAEVVALGIEEEALEEGLGVGRGRGLARTKAFVDFLEGFFLVAGRVLLEGADDGAFVDGGVDHAQRGEAVFLEGADDLLGEGLVGTSEHGALLGVDGVFHEHKRGDVFHVEGLGDLEVLDLVEEIEDVDVAGVADRAEQRRDEELAATAAAVEVNVEQVVVVELDFEPGAAVGDDAERVEQFAVRVRGDLEGDAGGAVELGNDDALGAVDDEGAAVRHHGDFAHVNVFVLDEVLFAEAELHIKGDGIGDAIAEALKLRVFRVTNRVGNVLEDEPLVVALNREDFAEDGLKALVLALFLRRTFLQEVQIRVDLQLNEIGRRDNFFKLTEVDAIGVITVGHGEFPD
ncbi:MAG: hypothetical protein BWX86_00818 [Verrucomicrobia bacterium ADurb.Bin122]|nr:MAG: hypothetical protein BWX86_00818 [Verrucomicrobia bacterium ADurb.Bin122]